MKKWIYKLLFLIAIVPLGLFMLPNKEVKAQGQEDFAPNFIKTTWISTNYVVENPMTHEFVVTYKIDGIIINSLKRGEYFLMSKVYIPLVQGYGDKTASTVFLDYDSGIQIEGNSTVFYVKITLNKTFVEFNYGSVANIDEFFRDDSAFYVAYDVHRINQTPVIPANIFEGIYYITGYNGYVWVVKNEIPEDTRFAVTYLDEEGTFHEYSTFYFGDMFYSTGDIKYLNPQSSTFSIFWQDVEHINRLVEAGYLFYKISFGISKPPVDILYRMTYYGTSIIIPIYPIRRIDDIFDIIELTEEELLAAYNSGCSDGYDVGYDDGYQEGYEKGYDLGDEEGYNLGYQEGYDDGYQEGINLKDDYMKGYNDGFKDGEKSKIAQNNETFYKSIEKWLVPAIITVIIAGGIVSIIAIKRRGQ